MEMQWEQLIVYLLAVICLFEKGFGADEVFTCPNPFINGTVNSITVKINKAAVAKSVCSPDPTLVAFSRRRVSDGPNSGSITLCTTDYNCDSIAPVSKPTPEKAQCSCVDKTDDIFTFEMKLYMDKEKDAGANFTYQLCVSSQHQTTKIQRSCTSVSVEDPDSNGCKTGCIVGITFGVLAAIAVIIGGIWYFGFRRN